MKTPVVVFCIPFARGLQRRRDGRDVGRARAFSSPGEGGAGGTGCARFFGAADGLVLVQDSLAGQHHRRVFCRILDDANSRKKVTLGLARCVTLGLHAAILAGPPVRAVKRPFLSVIKKGTSGSKSSNGSNWVAEPSRSRKSWRIPGVFTLCFYKCLPMASKTFPLRRRTLQQPGAIASRRDKSHPLMVT